MCALRTRARWSAAEHLSVHLSLSLFSAENRAERKLFCWHMCDEERCPTHTPRASGCHVVLVVVVVGVSVESLVPNAAVEPHRRLRKRRMTKKRHFLNVPLVRVSLFATLLLIKLLL